MRIARALAATLATALALGACQSARFGGPAPVASAVRPGPVYNEPPMEPAPPAPSGSVLTEPLPPPPGSEVGPIVQDVPEMNQAPGPVARLEPTPQVAAPSGRSSVVGGWTAREATGGTCRVQLSSSPALDLYKASASGCANRDLARVTAWDYREGEVYLYQPGGAVAARLRPSGGSMDGVLAKSGAPLALSR
jgi:hypothetical protein